METPFRDYLGTLNINLKVLSALLDEALENEAMVDSIGRTAEAVYSFEDIVMAWSVTLRDAKHAVRQR